MCWLGFHKWRWGCFHDALNGGHHICMTCNKCGYTPALAMIPTDGEKPMSDCRVSWKG